VTKKKVLYHGHLVVGTRGYRNGAPEKSVENELKQLPRLFKGFNVYLEGQFGNPYPSARDLTKVDDKKIEKLS
jgi:hypothetical protein